MRPVDAYVDVLKKEFSAVRSKLADGLRMGRLHLGGGTPTILSPKTMQGLLGVIFDAFTPADDFEFSVEIDPTDAAPELLQTLVDFGMNRASIGVQDFAPDVQAAIGRLQSLAQTREVVSFLRARDIQAINLDLLYGLPHQTEATFRATLDHVLQMDPDRLAIYGYAHVPWMSKRQVLIKEESLPDTFQRYKLSSIARDTLCAAGYEPIGIDHFAKPNDSLYAAHKNGLLRRNFQGYTDDQSQTLIGFGASAISRFKNGYIQNAVATSAYQDRIESSGFAGHKGYEMSCTDTLIAAMIEALMCRFFFPTQELQDRFPDQKKRIRKTVVLMMQRYPDVFSLAPSGLAMHPEAHPLVRIIAKDIDAFASGENTHAAAI